MGGLAGRGTGRGEVSGGEAGAGWWVPVGSLMVSGTPITGEGRLWRVVNVEEVVALLQA